MKEPWRNRIVKTGEVDVEQLLANEKNWRIHPKVQQDALLGAIEDIGIVKSILLNLRTSEQWSPGERGVETMVDGHLRVMLAMRSHQKTLPAEWCDLTPSEEAIALSTLDPLTSLAVADKEKLDALLREMPPVDARLQEMLAGLAEKEGLYGNKERTEAEPPDDFREYGENIETDYQCPKCGFQWSGKSS